VFIEAKDDGDGGDNWSTGAISRAKLQSKYHHQQNNNQFLQAGCPFLSPNQQCQSTEGNIMETNLKHAFRRQMYLFEYCWYYDVLLSYYTYLPLML